MFKFTVLKIMEFTNDELWKILTGVTFIILISMYAFVRFRVQKKKLIRFAWVEDEKIKAGEINLQNLQNGYYQRMATQTEAMAGVAITVTILATTLILDSQMDIFKMWWFRFILLGISISSTLYLFAAMYYNEAISPIAPREYIVKMRKEGSVLQSCGAYFLIISVLSSIVLVDTLSGIISAIIALIVAIYFYENKIIK